MKKTCFTFIVTDKKRTAYACIRKAMKPSIKTPVEFVPPCVGI